MVKAAGLLAGIEKADSARIAFGEVRYWMTDLAVSLLTLSEANAKTARDRMERYLDQLSPRKPARIAAVREELAKFDDLAAKAVEEYTADRRVIGQVDLAHPAAGEFADEAEPTGRRPAVGLGVGVRVG